MKKNYLTFVQAVLEVQAGKKIVNLDWGNKYYHHLAVIRTQEFEDKNIQSQPFIAMFFQNGGTKESPRLLPHPYVFDGLDLVCECWIVIK